LRYGILAEDPSSPRTTPSRCRNLKFEASAPMSTTALDALAILFELTRHFIGDQGAIAKTSEQ
jgi:hypothetical protein